MYGYEIYWGSEMVCKGYGFKSEKKALCGALDKMKEENIINKNHFRNDIIEIKTKLGPKALNYYSLTPQGI